MNALIGPDTSPSDSARVKWIALSTASFSDSFANVDTRSASASKPGDATAPPATDTSRSSWVDASFAIGVSFGITCPSTVRDFSTGVIVKSAVESENSWKVSFRVPMATATRAVEFGIRASVDDSVRWASAASFEPRPDLATASSYFFCASVASVRCDACPATAAPKAATASVAPPTDPAVFTDATPREAMTGAPAVARGIR